MDIKAAAIQFANIIVTTALTLGLPVVLTGLAGLAWQGVQLLRAKIGEKKWAQLIEYSHIAVNAAEMSGLKEAVKVAGTQKREWAIAWLTDYAAHIGLKNVSVETYAALIEGALAQGINYFKVKAAEPAEPLQTFSLDVGNVTATANVAVKPPAGSAQ